VWHKFLQIGIILAFFYIHVLAGNGTLVTEQDDVEKTLFVIMQILCSDLRPDTGYLRLFLGFLSPSKQMPR
jgi:hypothetical protein